MITGEYLTNWLNAAWIELEFKGKAIFQLLLFPIGSLFHMEIEVLFGDVINGMHNQMKVNWTFEEALIHQELYEFKVEGWLH